MRPTEGYAWPIEGLFAGVECFTRGQKGTYVEMESITRRAEGHSRVPKYLSHFWLVFRL